jgi:HK97 gp10 family phage protein
MARPAVEVVGGKELERALRRLPLEMQRHALDKMADKAAAVVEEEARRRAPRGRTGGLAASIGRARDPEAGLGTWLVGPSAGTKASRKDGFYGLFLELGTRERKRKNGGSTGRVRAQHWLKKSLNGARTRATEAMTQEARRQVEQVAARVYRRRAN